MGGDAGVRFALLGAVRAWRAGAELALGSPSQRLLAALLVAEEGRPLSGDALVDRMWGDRPPARARGALRTYASRLRAALEARFLEQAGGDPVRAQHLRKAHFQRLALKSAIARRKAREQSAAADLLEAELEAMGGDAHDAA